MEKIDHSIFALEAFVHSSGLLDSLRPCYPTAAALVSSPPSEPDDHQLHRKMVAHVSYAFAFELAVKILYELDTGSWPARNTHDLPTLFYNLDKGTQQKLEDCYDRARNGLHKLSMNKDVLSNVRFATFKEALENNADTVRDFKYDFELKRKTVAFGGVVWDGKTIWCLPPKDLSHSFPASLLPYIKDRRKGFFQNNQGKINGE